MGQGRSEGGRGAISPYFEWKHNFHSYKLQQGFKENKNVDMQGKHVMMADIPELRQWPDYQSTG